MIIKYRPLSLSDQNKSHEYWQSRLDRDGFKFLKIARIRLLFVLSTLICVFSILSAKVANLGIEGFQKRLALEKQIERKTSRTFHPPKEQKQFVTPRAFVDRNGVLVAQNVTIASLYADASLIKNADEVSTALAKIIPSLNVERVKKRLAGNARFVWLHRRITPAQQLAINRLGVPGLDFKKIKTRLYPHGHLVSHIIGYRNLDNQGIAGLEQALDDDLFIDDTPLSLSLDVRVQHVLKSELENTIEAYEADSGVAIVMDIHTGQLLGMVSFPDFDPNRPSDFKARAHYHSASVGRYELGSVFKVLNTAIALDSGKVDISSHFDAGKPLVHSRRVIRDYRAKNRKLSVPEILIYSSNIGSAKMILETGA
ncbi:MAG: penicillin-binding transpeptidase domain-containing protein, partial [Pseudomonadota bacterium]